MTIVRARRLTITILVAALSGLAPLALLLTLGGCSNVARGANRTQLATADWGLDVRQDAAGQVQRVYIEGPPGAALGDQWTITTGTSPDRRAYLRLERKNP